MPLASVSPAYCFSPTSFSLCPDLVWFPACSSRYSRTIEPCLDFLSLASSLHADTDCISYFIFSVCPLSLSKEIPSCLCWFGQYFVFPETLLSQAWCPQPTTAEVRVSFEIAHTHRYAHTLPLKLTAPGAGLAFRLIAPPLFPKRLLVFFPGEILSLSLFCFLLVLPYSLLLFIGAVFSSWGRYQHKLINKSY